MQKELAPVQGVLQGPADSESPMFLAALADDSLGQGTRVDSNFLPPSPRQLRAAIWQ